MDPSLEPEELAAAESIAFGSEFAVVPRKEDATGSQYSIASTIVSAVYADENE